MNLGQRAYQTASFHDSSRSFPPFDQYANRRTSGRFPGYFDVHSGFARGEGRSVNDCICNIKYTRLLLPRPIAHSLPSSVRQCRKDDNARDR